MSECARRGQVGKSVRRRATRRRWKFSTEYVAVLFCVVSAAFTVGGVLQQKERKRLSYEAKKARLAADPAFAVHY
jgi:hypothetical protein